jgi:hypothetical protein
VYDAARIFFVSDGAPVLHWIRQRSFPTAIELLDPYHLSEQRQAGVGAASPAVLTTTLGAAAQGDLDALLAIIRAHDRHLERADPEQAARARALIVYVIHNRQGIANSGPMEKGVDLTIGRRLKSRGMSCHRRAVSALLRLRLLSLHGARARSWAERFSAASRPWPAAA